jgi:hypothetical protein
VDEGGGLENRFSERRRGFESLSLRQNRGPGFLPQLVEKVAILVYYRDHTREYRVERWPSWLKALAC